MPGPIMTLVESVLRFLAPLKWGIFFKGKLFGLLGIFQSGLWCGLFLGQLEPFSQHFLMEPGEAHGS